MHDWHQIHERHGPLVWKTVYRILRDHTEALDCFQDVFAEVFEQTSSRPVRDWPAFLRWIAVRRALDRLRKCRANSRHLTPHSDITAVTTSSSGPSTQAECNELVERLRHELLHLPNQQAEAFWLRSVEEMSQSEIAHHMGITANAVGVLIHRARQRLRQALAELNPARPSLD